MLSAAVQERARERTREIRHYRATRVHRIIRLSEWALARLNRTYVGSLAWDIRARRVDQLLAAARRMHRQTFGEVAS